MAIKTDIRGLIWRYPEPFLVGREKIREFAKSIKCEDPACYDEAAAAELGYDSVLAPLTFVAILAKLVQSDFFRNVDTGYTTMQMVQVDQGSPTANRSRPATSSTRGWRSRRSTSGSALTS